MNDDREAPVDIANCKCVKETDRALLIEHGGAERWVPKSVVHDDSEVFEEDHEGTLVLKSWFAEREGWP